MFWQKAWIMFEICVTKYPFYSLPLQLPHKRSKDYIHSNIKIM